MMPALALLVRKLVQSAAAEVVGGAKVRAEVQLDLTALMKLRKGARRAVFKAAGRAAKPVRAAVIARAEAIRRYGFLAKSIGTKTRTYPGGRIVSVVGPKMKFSRITPKKGKSGRDAATGRFTAGASREGQRHVPYLYSWLLEKGTKRSRKKPFLKPAWDAEGAGYRGRLLREIDRELAALTG